MKKGVMTSLKLVFVVFYPIFVFWALKSGYSPRILSLLLILAVLFQLKSQEIKLIRNAVIIGATVLFSAIWIYNDDVFLKLYPILISLSFLCVFALSLKFPPSIVEKFARIKHKDLPKEAISYCQKVTKIWCLFFILNACISFATVFLDIEIWTLYNGLISYILIGALMTTEFLYRTYYAKAK